MAKDATHSQGGRAPGGSNAGGSQSGGAQSGGSTWDQAKSTMEGGVAELRDQAERQGGAVADTIRQGAQSLSEQAKDRVTGYAEGAQHAVTEHLDTFAQAIRSASDELTKNDQTMAAQLVRQAANGLEGLSRSVSGASVGDMVDNVRDFGRRNPAAFIGGAVLVGLALGRFVRSSGAGSDNEWESASSRRQAGGQGGGQGGSRGRGRGGNEGISASPYAGGQGGQGSRSRNRGQGGSGSGDFS